MNNNRFKLIILIILVYFFSSFTVCRLYRLELKLNPEEKKFLSEVRYIITKEERKIFLELPQEERKKFIEEFWKRRDPDPSTEINEFKLEYYQRIEEANKLFRGEGREGWLTDRGRIYITFGPPDNRLTYPMGHPDTGRPTEIWYYGWFPVIFVDYYFNGTYTLQTYNVVYLHELNKAQAVEQSRFDPEKQFFDLNLQLKKLKRHEKRIDGLIIIEIPYKGIWFSSKDDKLETTLKLSFDISDKKGNIFSKYENKYTISLTEEELKNQINEKYLIEINFTFEDELAKESKKNYILNLKLVNLIGGEEIKKKIEFNV